MHFCHSPEIWRDYPELVPGVLVVEGITPDADVGRQVARLCAVAQSRLGDSPEGQLPEVQAWRRTFSRMGLKPTQYRCAAESLLRHLRKEGSLPRIHPLIDISNAVSAAFAIPVAAFDVAGLSGNLEVRYAVGTESCLSLAGEMEVPSPDEVIFVDDAWRVHARRWTNRQSGYSAVRASTTTVLIAAEAMHASAAADIQGLTRTIADEVNAVWSVGPRLAVLSPTAPRFDF